MRNAMIGVMVILVSVGVGRVAAFSEEAPASLTIEKVDVLAWRFVAQSRVLLYFVTEIVTDNKEDARQPPIQVWKVPITEQGYPNFKKATLMALAPQVYKVRKPIVFVSIVGDKALFLYKFQSDEMWSYSFITFLLSEDFSVFQVKYQWEKWRSEGQYYPRRMLFNDGSRYLVNASLVAILAITVDEKDKIVITATLNNGDIIVIESVDNGKTWTLPRVLDATLLPSKSAKK